MKKIIAELDYVQGHLRRGCFVAELEGELEKEFLSLKTESEKKEFLKEVGELVIEKDDYEVDDYGDIMEITVLEK